MKPTKREFQYDKKMCFICKSACLDNFEEIEPKMDYRCSNCKVAFEYKNKSKIKGEK